MAIDRVVLHIGESKTGTTALQRALWLHEDWLAARGVHVLRSERGQDVAQHELFRRSDDRRASRCEVEALRRTSTRWTVVVSSESFVHLGERTEEVGGHLATTFGDTPIDAVAYLRHPLDWVQSSMIQAYRGDVLSSRCILGLNRPLHEIEDTDYAELASHSIALGRFGDRIPPIAERLGARSLELRPYHRSILPDGSIFRDFLDVLGIDQPEHVRGDDTVNHSLTLEAIAAIDRLVGPDTEIEDGSGPVPAALDLVGELGGQSGFLRAATLGVVYRFVADDFDDLLAAHPQLESIREPVRRPADAPDQALVDRYAALIADTWRRPFIGGDDPVSTDEAREADPQGRVVVRISRRARMHYSERFRVAVVYRDGRSETLEPLRLTDPGALFEVRPSSEESALLEFEGIRP